MILKTKHLNLCLCVCIIVLFYYPINKDIIIEQIFC